jgi:hypothetical protein
VSTINFLSIFQQTAGEDDKLLPA